MPSEQLLKVPSMDSPSYSASLSLSSMVSWSNGCSGGPTYRVVGFGSLLCNQRHGFEMYQSF